MNDQDLQASIEALRRKHQRYWRRRRKEIMFGNKMLVEKEFLGLQTILEQSGVEHAGYDLASVPIREFQAVVIKEKP